MQAQQKPQAAPNQPQPAGSLPPQYQAPAAMAAQPQAPAQAAAAQAGTGQEAGRPLTAEKTLEVAQELQTLCAAWFAKVRNGLEEPYDVHQAKADQEKIMLLFDTLGEELRKTGLENLFVDKKIKTASGEDVQLPNLPKHVLANGDVTSFKMIADLKTMIGKMGEDLEALHSVAERASRSLAAPPAS